MLEEAEAEDAQTKVKVGCLLKMIGKFVLNSTDPRKQEFIDLIASTASKFKKKLKLESKPLAKILGGKHPHL